MHSYEFTYRYSSAYIYIYIYIYLYTQDFERLASLRLQDLVPISSCFGLLLSTLNNVYIKFKQGVKIINKTYIKFRTPYLSIDVYTTPIYIYIHIYKILKGSLRFAFKILFQFPAFEVEHLSFID